MGGNSKATKKSSKKYEPLQAAKSEGWIDKTPLDGKGKEKLKHYLQRFVAETEAMDSSKRTGGFIDDLEIYTTERVRSFQLQMMLGESVAFRSFEDPGRFGEALREMNLADDSFLESNVEFVYLCSSSSGALAKRINRLKEFRPNQPKKRDRKRQNKSEFRRLDALLRHLRNAFAHGQFRRVKQEDGAFVWALQDSNSRGRVTARFLLKESTLDSWETLIFGRDKRYRNQIPKGHRS